MIDQPRPRGTEKRSVGIRSPREGLSREESRALRALCRTHGVRTRHEDGFEREVAPPAETLSVILQALGVPLENGPAAAPEALRALESRRSRALVPPTLVLWTDAGEPWIPGGAGLDPRTPVEVRLELEKAVGAPRAGHGPGLREGGSGDPGEVREWTVEPGPGRRIRLPETPPTGYHTLHLQQPAGTRGKHPARGTASLIVAPPTAFGAPDPDEPRRWGLFLPLHALRHRGDWGIGDLSGLRRLVHWTRDRGGDLVGTLPLLSAFLDEPFEPSPYAPASRLFWNELYLDLTATPEWQATPGAAERLEEPRAREALQRLRYAPRVSYRETWRLKRDLLDLLAGTWREAGGLESDDFRAFAARRPELFDYASFRAAREVRGPWRRWPAAWRDSGIPAHAVPGDLYHRHLYAQYRTARQVEQTGGGLYLDLPLGTHGEGYDVWTRPDLFADGVSGGAPADGFHPDGQTWGFPPLRPDTLGSGDGLGYFAACVRHLMDPADALRIDHVMSLHRLFWVPDGATARDGAYVAYPAEALHAIVALESHRARATVVGEDLGTVPEEVRRAMTRHGLRRMYVLPFEVDADSPDALAPVPQGAMALMDTHDMPPFAAFWRGTDIAERVERGALEPGERAGAYRERKEVRSLLARRYGAGGAREQGGDGEGEVASAPGRGDAVQAHRALVERLGRTSAGIVMVNVEDLWGEEGAQNVPGTPGSENWRQRARHPLEAFDTLPEVVSTLEDLHRARQRAQEEGPDDFKVGGER